MIHTVCVSKASKKIVSDVVGDTVYEAEYNAKMNAIDAGFTMADIYVFTEYVAEQGVVLSKVGDIYCRS